MQELFIKPYTNREIGHLYEHTVLNFVHVALCTMPYLSRFNYVIEGQTVYDGTVILRMEGSSDAVQAIREQLVLADQKIRNANRADALSVRQIEAEYRKRISFKQDKVVASLQELAESVWYNQENVASLSQISMTRKLPTILEFVPARNLFAKAVIDIRMNRSDYEDEPAMIFVFDELAAFLHEQYYAACIRHRLPVYWSRTYRTRNKTHARSAMILTIPKDMPVQELETARDAVRVPENFDECLQAYLKGFTHEDDSRLQNICAEFYKTYGVMNQ